MKTILVTGASGFIGQAICRKLSENGHVIDFGRNPYPGFCHGMTFVRGNITDPTDVQSLFSRYKPDVVVHCAGIAHQKFNIFIGSDDFDQVNNRVTKNLAMAAAGVNPNVHFIFLSSSSVYGEKNGMSVVKENDICRPTSPYAVSKLNAEDNLACLFDDSLINKLDVLRLSPVYDTSWALNLEKRVFAPPKLFYIKFGSGNQKMSVLSRGNLADFISFRLENCPGKKFYNTLNICDQFPCSFNEIIKVFKASKYQPDKSTVRIPLELVRGVTHVTGKLVKTKSAWIHSFYDKLANNLVFDNKQMLDTGFCPNRTIKTVFLK